MRLVHADPVLIGWRATVCAFFQSIRTVADLLHIFEERRRMSEFNLCILESQSYLTIRKCGKGRLHFMYCMVLLVRRRWPALREVEAWDNTSGRATVGCAAHRPLQGRVRWRR